MKNSLGDIAFSTVTGMIVFFSLLPFLWFFDTSLKTDQAGNRRVLVDEVEGLYLQQGARGAAIDRRDRSPRLLLAPELHVLADHPVRLSASVFV